MRVFFLIAAATLSSACTIPALDLSDRSCPCVDGWSCDEARNVCIEESPPDAAVADAGPECTPADEECNGEDEDCDGEIDEGACASATIYASCAAALAASETLDGVYRLRAGDDEVEGVYCDMTTDEGGWTLVASSAGDTFNDQASAYYADLSTLAPADANRGVWDGLRPLGPRFDVRFTCREGVGSADAPFDVDLSFYDVIWYDEWTTGSDDESCFSEGDEGMNSDPAPARRDNLADATLPAGDPWNSDGYLEGEDACDDAGDFTVDFDDRGMDSDEEDGTDWGEDDGELKCGVTVRDGQWFVFVREG